MDILNMRAPVACNHERSEADLTVWREAARQDAIAAICTTTMHPLAPADLRPAPVLVALGAINLALKAAASGDRKMHRSAADLAHLVAARDLLELVGG